MVDERSPTSPDSTLRAGFSPISPAVESKGLPQQGFPSENIDEKVGEPPPVPPERRMCGLKRKHFWELFALILSLFIAAAVIGGVVGGLQTRNGDSHSPPAAASSNNTNTNSSNTMISPAQ